jgi:hypothetical protein
MLKCKHQQTVRDSAKRTVNLQSKLSLLVPGYRETCITYISVNITSLKLIFQLSLIPVLLLHGALIHAACIILGDNIVYSLDYLQPFSWNILFLRGQKVPCKPSKKSASFPCYLPLAGISLSLFFEPEDRSDMSLRNVGQHGVIHQKILNFISSRCANIKL